MEQALQHAQAKAAAGDLALASGEWAAAVRNYPEAFDDAQRAIMLGSN